MPVRRRRRRDARRADRAHGAQLALLPPRRRTRAALRLPRPRARTSPPTGQRFNPGKLLIDPYAKAIDGVVDWDDAPTSCPTSPTATRTPISRPTTRTTRRRSRKSVVIDPHFDWEGDAPAAHPVGRDGDLRDPRRRASPGATPACREDLRGTYAGLAVRGGDRPPDLARRHRGRAAAGAPHRRRGVPRTSRGCTNYWGYSTIGYLAPHSELRAPPAAAASRCASSRGW